MIPDMSYQGGTSLLGYGPYFLSTILHQGMSRALNLPLQPKGKEEFQLRLPDTIELGGYPVIQSADAGVRERAIHWLLRLQDEVAEWPEPRAAASSYSEALSACRNVPRQLQRLQLQAGLPVGSRCEICRDWNL